MFVQVIQGRVSDAAAARARLDQWMTDLAPGAIGWLGSTAGVTDDGTLVVLARFESEEAARQNSQRPEQSAWWEETRKVFTGEPEFHDSTRVDVDVFGEPNDARFVQVMQGRTTDPARAREVMNDDSIDFAGFRPDVLGSLSLEHDGDAWTMALYFTSEEDAREGERKEPPPEMQKMMQELEQLSVGEPTYFDLKEPWLSSPTSA
jgi:quinol monooxygenase YgiN